MYDKAVDLWSSGICLALERLRGFSEGAKSMGGHFDPTLKKRV